MDGPLQLPLLDLVALIQAHFHPLEARVNFPGKFDRLDNIKVVDEHEILRQEYSATTSPTVLEMLGEILFERWASVYLEISDPAPDPDDEDVFRWELVHFFNIDPDLDPEEWLSTPQGRRAWGEWTTWHDHHRIATVYPPA